MGIVLVGSWILLIGISIPALIMGTKVIRWLVLCSYAVALLYSLYEFASMGPYHGPGWLWFLTIYGVAAVQAVFCISLAGGLYYFFRWFFYGNKKNGEYTLPQAAGRKDTTFGRLRGNKSRLFPNYRGC